MLKKLTVSNFKAWRELDMPLGSRVTGLFGTNSSGKSSVLQFLLMLKQTKNATDRGLALDFGGPNEPVNLGSFCNLVHQHKEESQMDWLLDWTLPQKLKISDPTGRRTNVLFHEERLQMECGVSLRRSKPWVHRLAYKFGEAVFTLAPLREKSTQFRLSTHDSATFKFVRKLGRAWPLPGPVKTHLFPGQTQKFYQNADFLSDFELEYERLMDSIFYLGPLRERPEREYRWTGSSPMDVGPRGKHTVDAILAATAAGERRNLGPRKRLKPFQEMIAHWLRTLGLIHSFDVREIAEGAQLYQVRVHKDRAGAGVMLTDIGFGVSQVLPVLVLLYYVPKGSIVLMEQPELHLHPSAQSGLADVILSAALTRKIQVIVESHSEHLLRRLQRRVAEGEATPKDVKLYFTSMLRGSALLSDLDLNVWGEIQSWPDNFFGDELGEIAAIRIAGLERKRNGNR